MHLSGTAFSLAALLLGLACQSGGSPAAQSTVATQAQAPVAVAPGGTASPAGGSPSPTQDGSSGATATAVPTFNPNAFKLEFTQVVSGLKFPLFATHAGDSSGNIYVVEKAGTIRVVKDNAVRPTPFLDITPLVRSTESERGLLGLAFHPSYKSNRQFFIDYTDQDGDTVIARYIASPDGNTADPNSAKVLLEIDQPYANHNGGMVAFGPDGKLYIGMGDGGSAGDPQNRAQNKRELLGKILRLDVDSGDPYSIPTDNPFVNDSSARPEIWTLGMRNPWRFSFDRQTRDLYIGDVGQNSWEEIDRQRAGSTGGHNYGWNRMEGRHCYPAGRDCDRTGLELPIAEYETHEGGSCSVTGGYIYRGRANPALYGGYFFADYCGGYVWSLTPKPDGTWTRTEHLKAGFLITSFGEDEAGEVYITSTNGGLYRLTAR